MKRLPSYLIIALFVPSIVSGCASFTDLGATKTSTIRYETTARAVKPADYPIEIFDLADVARSHKVVGIVQANAGKLKDPEDTLERLRAEARQMGGDALIDLQREAHGGAVVPVGDTYVYGNLREIWSAKVVVWTDSESP